MGNNNLAIFYFFVNCSITKIWCYTFIKTLAPIVHDLVQLYLRSEPNYSYVFLSNIFTENMTSSLWGNWTLRWMTAPLMGNVSFLLIENLKSSFKLKPHVAHSHTSVSFFMVPYLETHGWRISTTLDKIHQGFCGDLRGRK